jgi:hypothetical protein
MRQSVWPTRGRAAGQAPAQVQEQAPGPVADQAANGGAYSGQGGPKIIRPGRSQDPTGR